MKTITAVIFFSIICFGYCSSEGDKETPKLALQKIPPGHAEINGEIIKIFPIEKNNNPNDPCSKAPCFALVRVTKTYYGAGFPVIPINSEIKIKFGFTLNPTSKELFPSIEDRYPGLNIGDKFSALVSHQATINSTIPSYRVFGYSKK